jgi:hypothetical protein
MKDRPRRPTLVPQANRPPSLDATSDAPGSGAAGGSTAEGRMLGAALQVTCSRVCDNLREFMGIDGCSALLDRAIARTEDRHPVWREIRRRDGDGVHLDGIASSVELHGIAAVTAAVNALLAALFEVLARLIGEDLALRVMELEATPADPAGGEPTA